DCGSAHPEVFLIVCGSAASWIIKKILRNRGGLHNRVTRRMKIEPFTLAECENYFVDNEISFERRDIAESYMIFGGVPFYLSLFDRRLSLPQNVDAICFSENAPLKDEFEEVFYSLFKHADLHIQIIKTLARKKKGLYREEIVGGLDVTSGGGLTDALYELEQSGFITVYDDYSGKNGRYCFRLTDAFSLFYLTYMAGRRKKDMRFWSTFTGQSAHNSWRGYAFVQVCFAHTAQIKDALGIAGLSASISTWRSRVSDPGAQIDLIIERNDGVINLCEVKYTADEYLIDKKYSEALRNKRDAFRSEINPKKTLHLTMISGGGLKTNAYSNIVQSVVTLEQLFQ
ncbi:MAG: ATP-binding protein, partial [Clostridiales Family XIII bacterium]|nr:ATP-binding protein [Clostridiales Family XIII bacterium]